MTSPKHLGPDIAVATGINPKYLPPPWVEYCFYVQLFYQIMGEALGISINLLGVGMLVLLTAFCVMRMGGRTTTILRPVALPLACGVSFLIVQVFVFGQPLMGNYVREFVPWMVGLVLLQCLALRRGFLHRFAIVAFLIGLATLPYLKSFANDEARAGLDKTIGIANPNDLGAWFGFCGVYLTILGLETRLTWLRAVSWVSALGCLFVVGLTVSRAPLLAAAVSIVFALRRVVKRGFLPLLSLAVLAWIVYGFGLFAGTASMYAQRGLEDSGRFVVWPLAIERFLEFPLTGIGANHLLLFVPATGARITPHNSFIFIALASGAVPFAFFVAYWGRLLIAAHKIYVESHEDAVFATSLLLYGLMIALELNEGFMAPWVMVTACTVAGTGFFLSVRQEAVGRLRMSQAAGRHSLITRATGTRA